MDNIEFIIIGVCVIAGFNIYINLLLIISKSFSIQQKFLQMAFIWFIPIVGSLVVYYFINDSDNDQGKPPGGYGNSLLGVGCAGAGDS